MAQVVNERFRALAPSYGADIATVAKWALTSLRLRQQRDVSLSLLMLIGAAVSIVAGFSALGWPLKVIFIPATFAAFCVPAWFRVRHEYLQRLSLVNKSMLRGRFRASAAPEPRDRLERDRLNAVSNRGMGNLVVFSGHRAFAGCGQHLSSEHLVIDVRRPKSAKADAGGRPEPKEFTTEDVHGALIAAMESLEFPELRVRERLFVNGLHIQGNTDFLPNPQEAPRGKVHRRVLSRYVLHPTPDARVYVCVEMPGWRGQLVVTLFARAVTVGSLMYVEWRLYVLPPLRPVFLQIDKRFDDDRLRRWSGAGWRCAKKTPLALTGAPVRLVAGWCREREAKWRWRDQAYAIARGQVFDYGAAQSVREEACGRGRQHFFLKRDEVMFVVLAQERLVNAVRQFVGDMNVDTSQLDHQIKVITEHANKHYSKHLGDGDDKAGLLGRPAPLFRPGDD